MFGKIKGKLKGVFSKGSDEIFDEDEIVEESIEKVEESKALDEVPKPPKSDKEETEKDLDYENEDNEVEEDKAKTKGFFGKIFGKKDAEEEKETEEIQDEILEGVSEKEKEEIKSGEDVDEEISKKQKKELEKNIEKEEIVEKEEILDVKKDNVKDIEDEVPKPSKLSKIEEKKEDILEEPKEELVEEVEEDKKEEKKGFFKKTFGKLTSKKLTEDDFDKIWMELEIFLLEINIAYEIVERIESHLRTSLIDGSFDRFSLAKKIREILIEEVNIVLEKREANLLDEIKKIRNSGEVVKILVLGVNGTGKTTSIAKFVHYLKKQDLSVVVAAADTFRAAAVEQLGEHAQRVGFKLIKHKGGSDPAAVAFDAIEHANAKNVDVVLIDTAGRMPNNSNLMNELSKIERVSKSQINLFIGDSVSGNDLLEQIDLFDKIVGITGMILTKTDTDEKPGSIVTAAYSIEKPIYYLGIGQGYDDLVKFDGKQVAEKLFEIDE